MTKICCVSDLHGFLPQIPPCHLLILAGDYCPHTKDQHWWFRDSLAPWLQKIHDQGTFIVGIAGNHDLIFEKHPHLVPKMPWNYLQDSETHFGDISIYGSPWQPRFFDWAFNLDEPELAWKWDMIPMNIDILVTHGPPYMCCDATSHRNRIGSISLRARVEATKPLLHICGHNHAGYGIGRINDTLVVNASLVDEQYRPVHEPVVINWETLEVI